MNNVIFLDIDGVLTTSSSAKVNKPIYSFEDEVDETLSSLDINCIKNLKEIVDKTGSVIVITSTIKNTPMYPYVVKYLLEFGIKIIDKTDINTFDREEEITNYINYYHINEYLIIDDDFAPVSNDLDNHLITVYDLEEGLNKEIVDLVTKVFNNHEDLTTLRK